MENFHKFRVRIFRKVFLKFLNKLMHDFMRK